MKIRILSIFPDLFNGFLSTSLVGKAIERKLLECQVTNIRDYAELPHCKVDDTPYGGGPGMVMTPGPLYRAITEAKKELPAARTMLLSATGRRFTQAHAAKLSSAPELIFVCGRYEGVDQRVIDIAIDEEISIGDFVLMGGEVAAMVVIEATTRLIPGVIGNAESALHESFSDQTRGLLESPQYTRPPEFMGLRVPEVLLSGNHALISAWRIAESERRTKALRPDLLPKDTASDE
ncbi:MAG: tRNA (guanosine(37)-N1)-methyltransferase TrmD [Bdellovibrionota bacterium]|nr:MAG: tRNA (guanosine(37)-N1)-methyltransferase TrmD [Bdellovibrionota bacterium]